MADEWEKMGSGEANADYTLDGGSFGSEELGKGGEFVDKEGWYHFEVNAVKFDLAHLNDKGEEKSPCIIFECTVLESAPDQSPAGSRLFHRIYVGGSGGGPPAKGSITSALRFGVGLGILEYKEVDGREATVIKGTNNPKIGSKAWQAAEGKQFCSKIVKEHSEEDIAKGRKPKYAIPYGRIYQPDDPTVADCPKNAEMLKNGGYKDVSLGTKKAAVGNTAAAGSARGTKAANGSGNGSGAKKGGAPAAQTATNDDDPTAGL